MNLHLDNPSPRRCCYDDENIVVDDVVIESMENKLGGNIILAHQFTCQICQNQYKYYWEQELYTCEDWQTKIAQLKAATNR